MNQEEWEQSVTWIGIVAGCVIKQDGKYLLVQEKQQKVYGLWNIPAGYVDKDEEIEQAAIREVKEETGYEVALDGQIAMIHESVKAPLKHIFKTRIVSGELTVQEDEILDAQWLSFKEIEALNGQGKLRSNWMFNVIRKVEGT